MINFLTENLPETVNIDGAEVPINTDFRISLQFEMLIQSDIPDKEKIVKALKLYYPKIPQNIETAVERIIEFYSGNSEKNDSKSKSSGRKIQPVYSFKYDADYIYSAFLQAYNIDLTTVEMHWYKFRALFKSLPEYCEIVKIMGYRAMPITSDMSKKQQEHYRKLQKIYALPAFDGERKMVNEIEEALMNGGDVQQIIEKYKG